MTGVWLRPARPSRGGPPLSRDRIVAAAVELLDRDGVGGLTMRRLAERLDAGPTTLYWHVATKDDVVDLALDHIFGEVALPADPNEAAVEPGRDGRAAEPARDGRATEPARDWRADVEMLLLGWLDAMLRHPWSAALLGRPMLGPNVLTRTEFLQAALRRSGLAEPDLGAGTYALANYVIGSAVALSSWRRLDAPEPRQAAREHLAGQRDRYPTLVDTGHLDDRDWEATFRQGLTYLLDGLAART